jgi:hypothetical protein
MDVEMGRFDALGFHLFVEIHLIVLQKQQDCDGQPGYKKHRDMSLINEIPADAQPAQIVSSRRDQNCLWQA